MVATDTNLDALLRAVIECPADDLPRLVYADAVEEAGEVERAEFIRVQCELAKWEMFPGERFGATVIEGRRYEFVPTAEKIRREREIWHARSREWFVDESMMMSAALPDFTGPMGSLLGIVCRGFVAEVRCPLAAWLEHGPRIVREHPVERVTITDREPSPYHGVQDPPFAWFWFAGRSGEDSRSAVWELFRMVDKSYGTPKSAIADLSTAALTWAKSHRS